MVAKMEREFEEWFEEEAYLLQFSLVPPKSEIDKVVKGWMLEAYVAGRRDEQEKGQEEIEKLKEGLDHPPFQSYGEALREGCDSDGAWECFKEDYLRHVKIL